MNILFLTFWNYTLTDVLQSMFWDIQATEMGYGKNDSILTLLPPASEDISHTHTYTHTTFWFSHTFSECTWPWQTFFFSLWLFCVCYILLAFSPKHILNIYTSLQLCWHHPSSSHSYLLSAFSNSLKRGSLPYSCYSPIEHWL